ncbi:TPA: hypothetical protein IQA38_002930 [Listeria monocytogenes]|nr:hypothetical protein [Listeria monocytogenes]HAO6667106.1 hypothetical protein [Listeria monocytogenes]
MDVTLFLVRALSTKIYEKDITVLFDNHALEAYQAAQKAHFGILQEFENYHLMMKYEQEKFLD